jgi:hypothetical protein
MIESDDAQLAGFARLALITYPRRSHLDVAAHVLHGALLAALGPASGGRVAVLGVESRR